MMDKRCGNCKYYVNTISCWVGQNGCHKNAPVVLINKELTGQEVSSCWPRVDDDDWCGEWEKNETS